MIRVGKDESDKRSRGSTPKRSDELDISSEKIRDDPRSGTVSPVHSHQGVQDADKVIFGDIQNDLYAVQANDSRPKRLEPENPPDLKSGTEINLDDTEDESYISRPPEEPRPGPLHPGGSRRDSENTRNEK